VPRVRVLAVAGLVLGTLIVWSAGYLHPGSHVAIVAGDLFFYWLPAYSLEAERLRAGAVPLWNPYQAGGVPFLATLEAGALYPARLLLLAMDVPSAMKWSTIGHIVLAVVGTYALCRRVGATRAGAIAGAVVFGATFGFQNVYMPAFLEGGAWIPLAALALVRLLEGGGWGWVAVFGVAAGMPGLAGSHQIAVYGTYGMALLAAGLLLDRGSVGLGWPTVGRLVAAGVLALATAAPQVLPTILWSLETSRPAKPLLDAAIEPAPPGGSVWETLRATLVHGPLFLTPYFLSLPAVALAAIGALRGRRLGAVLGVGAVATYVLALGPRTPLFVAYRLLPGLSMFRFPSRLSMLLDFLAAVLAALGLTALARGRMRRAIEAVALAVLVVAITRPLGTDGYLPWTAPADAVGGPPDVFATLARVTGDDRAYVPGETGLGPRRAMLHGIRVLQDQESLSSRRLEAYVSAMAGIPAGADPGWPFNGALPARTPITRPALLDLVAVRGLVLRSDLPPPAHEPPLERVGTFDRRTVWRNASALPRAYTVSRARFVPDETAALAAVVDAGFDGHREAVVVGEPVDALADGPREPFVPARITRDGAEAVEVAVEVERSALLVLADAFAAGWRVTVDGAPRPLLQVNQYVRGVTVGPGDRRVEFDYRPPGLVPALVLAAVAWSAVVVGSLRIAERAQPLPRPVVERD
jgi:hypothetical protein